MKKLISVMLSLCMIMAVSLSLAACGSSDKDNSSSDTPSSSQEQSSEDNSSEEENVEGKFASIQEFIESDLLKDQLEELKKDSEEAGMKFEVYGEGNKLVYSYTFSEELSDTVSADALEEAITAQAETFKSLAGIIPTAVDVENAVVVVKYLKADETVIYCAEFTKD